MIKNKWKRNLILMLSLFAIIISTINPAITVLADTDNDANTEFNKQVDEYLGDSEKFTDIIDKIQEDSKINTKPAKNTMPYVMKRLFNIGEYINDVEEGVLGKDLGVEKSDILLNGRYACNPSSPNNLINHNCNIPNFTTGLIQNIVYPFMTPFNNAEKTSAYATFGFGVPNDIPGGIVPANPGNRAHTYTALELFGYDLKLTSYNGEWDRIDVSTQARMLSNFGVIDKFTLMGTGLWNAVKSGIGGLIENFSFNPMRWISGISNVFDSALFGGINTVIDTSDLNIVATNGWKRESFGGTLYNIYVLTDKEVLQETYKNYFREFIDELQRKAEVSPELLEVLALEQVPGFTFIPDWETEESIAARQRAEAINAAESARAAADEDYSPRYVTVPDPVYYTEKEQLGFWAKDNQDIIDRAAAQGLISANPDDYETYEAIVAEWRAEWQNYFTREFNALGPVVNDLIERSDRDVFVNNPHLDPKQPISHYACANPDGSIMRNSSGGVEYLYLKNNKGSQEYLNPNCDKARPPISGGLFGSGWHISRPPDTRHISHVGGGKAGPIEAYVNNIGNKFISFSMSITSFIAKITNVILELSFSPILSELGIDTIVAELVHGFKDTIFFPMVSLAAAIGAALLFLQLLKGGSAWQLIISLFVTLVIFVASSAFLMHPDATIKMVDDFPSKIDNFLANAVLVDDDGTSYCSTGLEKNGIRSAQCNVWGIMVFNPWTHLQFGTGYDNLYAKGHAPSEGRELQNTNDSLVGDAGVYMGGGHTVNNWALYQLSKTKAGTINSKDISNRQAIGKVDKDMYRLVDLQAGPDGGAGTDSRYFDTWSGNGAGNSFIALLTIIQTIIIFIAITGLGIAKIEVSFLFALTIVFLPFVLLYAFFPQGKGKLRRYFSRLSSLLLKRMVITVMLATLLKTLSLSYSRVDSLMAGILITIVISVAFIMYRKEALDLITRTEGEETANQVKELLIKNTPTSIKQRYSLTKSKVRGSAIGFIGGASGTTLHRRTLNKRQKEIREELNKYYENDSPDKELTELEKEAIQKLTKESENITESLNDNKNTIFQQAVHGSRDSSQIIGRRTERTIRREGFAIDKVYRDAKYEVITQGIDSITNKDEPTVLDTYKEILSHGESIRSKTSEKTLAVEDGRVLENPKIQREVRRLAKEREKLAKENKNNKDYKALTPDKEELEKLAKVIDKKRKASAIKSVIKNPIHEKEMYEERKSREPERRVTSNVEDIKDQIIEKQKEKIEKNQNKGEGQ